MASTGTYNWGPSAADLVVNAFARIQIRRTELTQQHLADAAMEAALLQVEFANRMPLWWRLEDYSQTLTESLGLYTLPARTISIVAAYISTTDDEGTTTDRIITPISAYDYASYPQKLTEGQPNVFWLNRQVTPTITLWPVPDDADTYTLKLKMLSQIEDVSLPNGASLNMPVRFMDAFTTGLSARLAVIYKPEVSMALDARAERAFSLAAKTDSDDNVPIYITPQLGGYFRP